MIRYGILGAGGMGSTHARHMSRVPGVSLAVFDQDGQKSEVLANTFGAEICSSSEALIAKSDAVAICLPSDLHREYGMAVIAAGRAVFMEKPLAPNLADARCLLEAADKAAVPLMVGQVVRFFPEYAKANSDVKGGLVGEPAVARVRRGGGPPARGAKDSWFLDHSRSGGILIDLAVHDFDWLRWTLGEVETVIAHSLSATKPAGPDYALTLLKFESGALAHVESTWMDPSGFRTSFEVCGSRGMIEHDSTRIATMKGRTASSPSLENLLNADDDPYFRQLSHFVSVLVEGKEPAVSAYDGFMALSIATAASQSARTGKWVRPERN